MTNSQTIIKSKLNLFSGETFLHTFPVICISPLGKMLLNYDSPSFESLGYSKAKKYISVTASD
jgi:hypothetical protein